jgi:hypothetical protein
MHLVRIEFLIFFRRGVWRGYGPGDCVVQASSLRDLKIELASFVPARFGANARPILVVGPRKPPRQARPPFAQEAGQPAHAVIDYKRHAMLA